MYSDAWGKSHIPKSTDIIAWRIAGYALVASEKRLLVVSTPLNARWYQLPGGGINITEGVKEGTIRECYEETGYKINVTLSDLLYVSESDFYHTREKMFFHSISMFFKGSLLDIQQHLDAVNSVRPDEIANIEWINLKSLDESNCSPFVYPAINLLIQNTP